MARSMGPVSKPIVLVACEPAALGGEEGHIGLSEPVSAAVNGAVKLVQKLIAQAQANAPKKEFS
jgi:hydrogenase maturation protease